MTTQADLVLDALRVSPMTPVEAFAEFGITRLAARINELRKQGHKILTERVLTTNRLGGKCAYAKYVLVR